MMTALRERTATAAEWRALVDRVRAKNRRMARFLEEGGSSFVENGVRIHPPLKYRARDHRELMLEKTTTIAGAAGESE